MEFLRNVPIGQYVTGKTGWLRNLDPRLKFAWVLMFLITPVLAGPLWRIGLLLFLLAISVLGAVPLRIFWRSLFFLFFISCFFGLLAIFLPTNLAVPMDTVRSPQELNDAIVVGSSWELIRTTSIQIGPLSLGSIVVDRRSAELAIKTSTLIFTVVHSVNLMLITTSPEDLMWTLRWYLRPLSFLGLPLDRLSFQLLLALRFIPLVQEEFQNLIRSLVTRAVDFRKLGFKRSLEVFLSIGERLLANILLRAEQGADSLLIRNGGYLLHPELFKPKCLFKPKTMFLNSFSILTLFIILLLRRKFGSF
ncbi:MULTISPECIES: energy-coupling factor transporter transmembrane component T family protein [Prochlorococcus]|uniref:ABC-type cobalt transport system permease component n=1 Tax=Prochlorococcus marinus (strain SARG / CCMP1375 / SS120) TaxID=167539 RepID=Q7VDI7_PROMA|nr:MULTISPECIES: energy-coupling factor transporter transmembrane component T [Prochlorococcus]AAP99435.1 ABC-type cobalt transport system permease component [Prochlorococcus marinus subsp. marinus str. CCMP1375]KGG11296.1 transmembrane component of ECF transporter energizing module [Prochlorococcus marinus str. LG]KGG18750.1 transmembrane component of ECF transporter energizing module [Prochlorococcus marinus str. SS2]KGG23023.1 transmembrane component of ECF transporter energizing module [Pro